MTIHNAADDRKVKDQALKLKNQREQELEDIKAILDTPSGIRFFRRLMEKGKMFQTTFTGNSNSFFLEGHRNYVLEIFNDVCMAAPDKVVDLIIRKDDEDKDERNSNTPEE